MWGSFFIVWRESVEALLVIGILYAWIKREQIKGGITQLWIGSGLGILLAACLALLIYFAGSWYSGAGGEWFITIMMFIAACLIMQMVLWMHNHGHHMRHKLTSEATLAQHSSYGLVVLTMIAVAREGSETVVFLTGTFAQSSSITAFILGAVLGLLVAVITFILLQIFSHLMPWKWFFRGSAFILLLLGGALIVGASDKAAQQIAGYDDLPEWAFSIMYDPLWSTDWLYSDANGTLAGLIGYHANPTLSQIVPLSLYWFLAIVLFAIGSYKNK